MTTTGTSSRRQARSGRGGRSLVALVIVALISGVLSAAYAADGTLGGTVTEAGGGPLSGVTVQVFCWQVAGSNPGDPCGVTQTATDGTYSVRLAPGTYKVLFDDSPAHALQYYGGGTDLFDGNSLAAQVPDGGAASGIDAALVPLRTVAGTVTGSGAPADGINVTAYQQSGAVWEVSHGTLTGPDGTYALHLPDGTFRVGFADAHGPFRTEFFDDAAAVDQANDVVVAGGDVSGIDADLGLNFPITGTVTVDGVNMPGVVVTAWQQVPDGAGFTWEAAKVTFSAAEGAYSLYLPDGTFRVEFETWQARFPEAYFDGATTLETATDVVVAGAEVPNVNGAIVSEEPESGPAITGTITADGAAGPPEFVTVTAWRWNELTSGWSPVRDTGSGFDGTYALRVPEGTYRVGFSHNLGRYQTAYYDGADTIDDADDVVVSGADVANIDAVLVENHGISGTVTVDPLDGLPPGVPPGTNATAWRWNEASAQWESVIETFIGPDGAYALYVTDGTYRIGFKNDFFPTLQPVFYERAATIDEADDVVVAGANVSNINGHLGTGGPAPEPPDEWPPADALSEAGQDAWAPQVAVSPDGATTAVWYRRDGHHNRVQATSRAANGTWSSPVALSTAGEDAWDPQVAVGAHGRSVVVWRRWNGAGYEVQASTRRSAHGPWSAPVALSASGEDAWDPQVVVGSQGRAVAVWRRSTESGYQVRASVQTANGSWSAPVSLSETGGDAWGPQVAVGPDGTAVAAWSRLDGSEYRVQASARTADGSWSAPVALSEAGADGWDPQVAVGRGGAATVVWRRSDGSGDRIQAASRSSGATWSSPTSLSAPGQDAHDPQVAVGPDGTVIAVWGRWDGSTDRVQAASMAPAGTWSTPRNLSRAGQDAQAPQVSSGPDGRASVVWRQTDGVSEWVEAAIGRPDGTWPVPTDLSGSNVRAYGQQVATGSDGTVAVVWEWRDGAHDRVQGAVLDAMRQRGGGPHGPR